MFTCFCSCYPIKWDKRNLKKTLSSSSSKFFKTKAWSLSQLASVNNEHRVTGIHSLRVTASWDHAVVFVRLILLSFQIVSGWHRTMRSGSLQAALDQRMQRLSFIGNLLWCSEWKMEWGCESRGISRCRSEMPLKLSPLSMNSRSSYLHICCGV